MIGPEHDPLPRLPEVERALAGALMNADPEYIGAAREHLDPSDVTDRLAAAVIATVYDHCERGEPTDFASIAAALYAAGKARPGDLLDIVTDQGVPYYAEHYAAQLADVAARRTMIALAGDMAADAYRGGVAPAELAARLMGRLAPIAAGRVTEDDGARAMAVYDAIEAGVDVRAGAWPTGIAPMDEPQRGIMARDFVVIAGHRGAGKTWITCTLVNFAIRAGKSVGFFSLEMSYEQIMARIRANRLATSELPMAEAHREARAVLTDPQALRIMEHARTVRAIRALVEAHKLDLAIVDHGGLLEPPERGMRGYEAATANANGLQRIAHDTGAAVVGLTQISNEANRTHALGGGAGQGVGAKETGAWEANADMVVLLRGIWEPGAPPGSKPERFSVTVDKAKHGPGGQSREYLPDFATGRLIEIDPRRVALRPRQEPRGFLEAAAGGDE